MLSGQLERTRIRQNELIFLAWHSARFQRSKKMPKLKDVLLPDPHKPKRRQTMEEQIAIVMQWKARLSKH